jgi:hypothetical protein
VVCLAHFSLSGTQSTKRRKKTASTGAGNLCAVAVDSSAMPSGEVEVLHPRLSSWCRLPLRHSSIAGGGASDYSGHRDGVVQRMVSPLAGSVKGRCRVRGCEYPNTICAFAHDDDDHILYCSMNCKESIEQVDVLCD